jgi:putative phosphoesterase
MRLAVLSDVHGNLPALEAVLRDVERHRVDGVIVAGDFIGGPQPVETIRMLRALDGWMIRGNSDANVLRYGAGEAPAAWHTSRQWALMRWACRHLDEETFAFLASLPEQRVVEIPRTAPIRVVHGSPRHPAEGICPDLDPAAPEAALAQVDEPVLVCGHTHRPWKWGRDGRLALNPGAVCGPLDGTLDAQYALLVWQDGRWEAEHRAVGYDLARIRAAFRESGLLEEGGALARSFLVSIETGRNGADDFLAHAYALAAEAGFERCEVVPDAIWERAAATFEWDAY